MCGRRVQDQWSYYCKNNIKGDLFPNSPYKNKYTPLSNQPPPHTSATEELHKSFKDTRQHKKPCICRQLMLPSGQEKGRIDCNSSSSVFSRNRTYTVLAVLDKIRRICPHSAFYSACNCLLWGEKKGWEPRMSSSASRFIRDWELTKQSDSCWSKDTLNSFQFTFFDSSEKIMSLSARQLFLIQTFLCFSVCVSFPGDKNTSNTVFTRYTVYCFFFFYTHTLSLTHTHTRISEHSEHRRETHQASQISQFAGLEITQTRWLSTYLPLCAKSFTLSLAVSASSPLRPACL